MPWRCCLHRPWRPRHSALKPAHGHASARSGIEPGLRSDSADSPGDITVLVPTFRRPDALRSCLDALAVQTCSPAEVIVVIRQGDADSELAAESFKAPLRLRVVRVESAGQVQALNRGLAAARSDFVAITDDDAMPRPDWIERIVRHFTVPDVGAVGGRDVVHSGDGIVEKQVKVVGRVSWYGRVLGNHHLASDLQTVEFLKGANMSYRRSLLDGFDEHLAGDGPQVCNDMQVSLRVHARGWRVIWDPDVVVDHCPAQRFSDDERGSPAPRAVVNAIHNQTYILLSLLTGWRKVTAFLYGLMVGTRRVPGIIMLPVAIVSEQPMRHSMLSFEANVRGRLRGLATFLATRGQPRYPAELAPRTKPSTESRL